MNITFITNRLTHHQLPFCQNMQALLGGGFSMIATVPIVSGEEHRYPSYRENTGFLIESYGEPSAEIKQKIFDSDAVIIGSAPDDWILPRLKAGKLTFKYSERFLKNGLTLKTFPRALIGAWKHHGKFQKYPLYLLCSSAYTAADAARFGNYKGRAYRWGYFPEEKRYDQQSLHAKRTSGVLSVLWVGRMLDWKHPEAAVLTAQHLKQQGVPFTMDLIGTGPQEQALAGRIAEQGLSDCVRMQGAKSPEQVRDAMERADIFLFTSDFHEGWGAVLNEAMNSGCACVVSHAVGAAPFLIQNGINGYLYQNGNLEDLFQKTAYLAEHEKERRSMGEQAYRTIAEDWNANAAAKRFVQLTDCLLRGQDTPYASGPCSNAEILKNDWYQGETM